MMKVITSSRWFYVLTLVPALTLGGPGCGGYDGELDDGAHRAAFNEDIVHVERGLEPTQCVGITGKKLKLNKKLALDCARRSQCNNPTVNYLENCTKYVHADCFDVNGAIHVAGFHQGISEGGTTNRHFWDNVEKSLFFSSINKGGMNTIIGYNKQDCTGELFRERLRSVVP